MFEEFEEINSYIDTEEMEEIEDTLDDISADYLEPELFDNNEMLDNYDEVGEGDAKVLTLDITPEIVEGRLNDIDSVLDNYKDNLLDRGVSEDIISDYLDQEKEKMLSEFDSLDNGEVSENVYQTPIDWDSVAGELKERSNIDDNNIKELNDNNVIDITTLPEINPNADYGIEEVRGDITEINDIHGLDEIYEEIEHEALAQGFENIDLNSDSERFASALENFQNEHWENLSLEEQKETLTDLSDYLKDVIGYENPPRIEYYNNPKMGDYGGYDELTNTLNINEYMLYENREAADTIAHELWHAHQRECANNPMSARDYQYQYNFENYISPDLDFDLYQNQLIEAEARAFAEQIKEHLGENRRRL